ncbi:hypothetical protein HY628_02980 [Candidatus Uhrbacteria bacterium]|nr:hypothetical protein [Candidatus Uhrbacteria bacterium]
MSETFRRQMRALATLVGTIIGAGIFGVPFVISRAGLAAGIMYFVLLGLVTTILHWYYGQIVLAIPERHRFPGFAGLLGGATGRTLAAILGVLGGWLAITAYLILGGAFLNIIFGSVFGGTELVWSLVFALLGVLAVSGGLSRVSRSEIPLTLLLIGLLLFFVFRGLPLVDLSEIWSGSSQYFFLPYGVILFSLSGLAVIPELEDILGNGQRSALRRVIFAGTALATVLTALFGIVMAGVTGPETTKDAISGLLPVLGPWIVGAGALFGFLAVIPPILYF